LNAVVLEAQQKHPTARNKNKISMNKRFLTTRKPGNNDQGMALAIALLTGLLLLVATSGLMAKQIMQRRTGASESYKQLAELAASNGLNRILARMNDYKSADITYLWQLTQDQSINSNDTLIKQWDLAEANLRPQMDQPCYPLGLTSELKAELLGKEISKGQNLRNDGRGAAVTSSYRLRSYSYEPGDSKATFSVEGYATQGSGDSTKVLGRSLLTRVLALQRYSNGSDNWAAIAGYNLNLGPSNLTGSGRVLWLINSQNAQRFGSAGACSGGSLGSIIGSSNSSLQDRIWPLSSTNNSLPEFPSAGLFESEANATTDQVTGTNPVQRRIWNIDDNRSTTCAGTAPGGGNTGEAICTRGDASTSWTSLENTSTVKRNSGKVTDITLHSEQICNGSGTNQPCLVWIESIKLSNGAKLSIETGSSGNGAKPVVLRMLRSQEAIQISNGSLCQANYSASTSAPLPCSSSPKAERLAIVGTCTDPSCSAGGAPQKLTFGGNSLPAAIVLMPNGAVSITSNATMKGLLWANTINATPGINFSTSNTDGSNILDAAKSLWNWDKTLNFGRTISQGIRGTGLDMFLRW
jgi:hypothetical protein